MISRVFDEAIHESIAPKSNPAIHLRGERITQRAKPAGARRGGSQAAAVFLDKDGTVLDDVPYNVDPQRMKLAAGAADGLRRLHGAGYRLIVISNQSGVARGLFQEAALSCVAERLRELLEAERIPLDAFYYCPHHPDAFVPRYRRDCDCRKPAPGLIFRAAKERRIDLEKSWFVGDILNDVEAGRRAGCRTVLIDNGNETKWEFSPERLPDVFAADLDEAATAILSEVSIPTDFQVAAECAAAGERL
jgi:D,D-heptose 1,7-bisphosphate phosphatase